MRSQISPVEIARIQLDAEKKERLRIASNIRLMFVGSGVNPKMLKLFDDLCDEIEKGTYSQ